MQVYHGSYTEIETIDLALCREHRDFGRGFYVTKFRRHAEIWSERKGEKYNTQGFITEFKFSFDSFTKRICKIKQFETYDEEWLDFVVMNRNRDIPEPAHNYDIVEGPVADDKIQNRLKYYLAGEIPKAVFLEELKHHEETHQICFCTLVSLETLSRTGAMPVLRISMITEPLLETLMLERGIDEVLAADLFYCSGTFARLADSHTGWYKKTWQEIYELLREELEQGN